MALPNALTGRPAPVRRPATRAEYFLHCVQGSLARVSEACPECIAGTDIGIEDVPPQSAIFAELNAHDAIPLAAAIDAGVDHPARIVIYRRPLEQRAIDRSDLRHLVHQTLVEQLSILTGRSVREIDPEYDED